MTKLPKSGELKVEGRVQNITPTTINVGTHTLWIPPEKREWWKKLEVGVQDEMRITYDKKGNLLDAEYLTVDECKKMYIEQDVKAELDHPAGDQPDAKVHMEPENEKKNSEPAGGGKKTEIHMQTETVAPQSSAAPATQYNPRTWIPEQEREDRIVVQSVLSRAVDIVDAHYMHFPSSLNKADFNESLDTRINHIENTADRLFDYVTNKVEKEKGRARK